MTGPRRAINDEERKANNAARSAAYRARKKAREALGMQLKAVPDGGTADHDAGGKIAKGNKLHVTHGARDPERVSPIALQIIDELFALPSCPPELKDPLYERALWSWAYVEAQLQLMRAWADAQGLSRSMMEVMTSEETEVGLGSGTVKRSSKTRRQLSILQLMHSFEVRAMNARKALGLDPKSRGEMEKAVRTVTFDLAQMWAEVAEQDDAKQARIVAGEIESSGDEQAS